MAIQQIRDSTFTVGSGSLTIIAQSNCQGAFYFSSTTAGSTGAIISSSKGVSTLILEVERLQRSAKELSFELKLTTGSPVEYNDLAKTLDEMAQETIPYVFGFLLQGFRLDELCCRQVSGEIAYMQGILDAFARKRAVDRNGAMQTMKHVTAGEAIIDILWSYFWWLFYAQWLIRRIRQSLTVSRDKIYVILFKRMVSMCKSVRCHQIDIDDFFGAQWSIPQDLCLNRQVFLSILRFKFQDGPAEVVIKSEQFGVFRQDGLRAIQIPNWEDAIQEGGGLQLSVLVNRQSQAVVDGLECPQCGQSDGTIYGDSFDGWVECLRCNSHFNLASLDSDTSSNPAFLLTSGVGPNQFKDSSAFCRFSVTVTKTVASTTPWTSPTSIPADTRTRPGSETPTAYWDETVSNYPALMVPLLSGLLLLQKAVRSDRATHFAPSTACIISCVRTILSATETLQRDAPILQRYPSLGYERRQVLSVLAALVAQAKKAADPRLGDYEREGEVESMLRLGEQVFAHLDVTSSLGSTVTGHSTGSLAQTEEALVQPESVETAAAADTPNQRSHGISTKGTSSISSSASISSEGGHPSTPPAFPSGLCTGAQVMEALRSTHDQYLSTIAAFIGHAHSHSRTSRASSTLHLYDSAKKIVETVWMLLCIVEAVTHHPNSDVPSQRLRNLLTAKERLYDFTSSFVESVTLLSAPATSTEEEEKQSLLRSATNALKAGADCVASVKACLNCSTEGHLFTLYNVTEMAKSHPHSPNSSILSS